LNVATLWTWDVAFVIEIRGSKTHRILGGDIEDVYARVRKMSAAYYPSIIVKIERTGYVDVPDRVRDAVLEGSHGSA
jgi:hypothetical protein